MQGSLIRIFPGESREFWLNVCRHESRLEEIRLRMDKPVMVRCGGEEFFLDESGAFTRELRRARITTEEDIRKFILHICKDSVYAFEDQIRQGYLSVEGGHRVGVAGHAVLRKPGKPMVQTISNIAYINIRVAHEIRGVADQVMPYLYDISGIKNTLILSPPGCGKTTLLRDMIRQISDGNEWHEGLRVGVVDERSEIAGSFLGHAQNDLGIRTDVLDACSKQVGIMLLLRSMTPEVIAVDELGGEEDIRSLYTAAGSGCRILATVHGRDALDYDKRIGKWEKKNGPLFDLLLILGRKNDKPGFVEAVFRKEEI